MISAKGMWGLFLGVGVLELLALYYDINALRFYTKPLLMPLLAVAYVRESGSKRNPLLLLALGFAFVGDVLLLSSATLWLLLGIFSFLITQVGYSILVIKQGPMNLMGLFFGVLVFGGYGATFLYFIFPTLGEFSLAVTAYTIAIATFGIFAFQRFYSSPSQGYVLLLGAALFILSDSMIAINLFYVNYDFFTIEIMATYLAAQFFIVRYFLNNSYLEVL